jgi:hypothetical protein
MPERVLHLIIGVSNHQRQIVFSQDRSTEQFVALRDAGTCQRYNVLLNYIEQAFD